MDPKWHIAFCNVTYTEYAGVTYHEYYGSPSVMLEAQLAAKEYAEQRFGVGRFMHPGVDMPSCAQASFLGMPVIEPDEDEIPYLDSRFPVIRDVADWEQIRIGDPRTEGMMARRWEAWQYYRERGYKVGFGGYGGGVITLGCEISANALLAGLVENPDAARRVLDKMVDCEEVLAKFDCSLRGADFTGFGYVGDDYAGLLSPAMFREFAVPYYLRLYAGNERRFMHSELLRAEHLRIVRDEVGVTEFHGAGCELLTLEEMHEIMGSAFWTQLTPQQMLEMTPAQIDEQIKVFAGCGCSHVQLYPGRGTPDRNMDAAIEACKRECPGGPAW